MIVIALALQIVVGVLALIVTTIDKYYSKFADHIGDENRNWCQRFCCKKSGKTVNVITILDEIEKGHTDLFAIIPELNKKKS